MEALFWRAAGPLAADGMLVNVADTPANRAMFGCTGTAALDGQGSAPFPQLKITARAGRAMLGAVLGRARAGEQALLGRLVRREVQRRQLAVALPWAARSLDLPPPDARAATGRQ